MLYTGGKKQKKGKIAIVLIPRKLLWKDKEQKATATEEYVHD